MEEIRKAGGRPSELEITQHVPKQAWKVSTGQILKMGVHPQRER